MKKLEIDCEFVIYPFGKGMPVCIRRLEKSKQKKDLRQCLMAWCSLYKVKKEDKEV